VGGQGADGGDGPEEVAPGEIQRGWISPDDRLWRHPSESGHSSSPAAGGALGSSFGQAYGATTAPAATRSRTSPRVIGGATAVFVVVLVATGMVIAANTTNQPSSGKSLLSHVGPPTTDSGLSGSAARSTIDAMVDSVRPSMVLLRIHGDRWTRTTTGLVAEAGGIIVTASEALEAARSVTVVEPDGSREPAVVVGVDRGSGVAVVRIEDDLPAVNFDDTDPGVGTIAIAAGLHPFRKATSLPSSLVYAGRVASTGQALGLNAQTDVFSATAVRAPLTSDDIGCPLVAEDGHVVGMLTMLKGKGSSTMGVFLPAQLVFGVAFQLVASGEVDHGWFGIETSNPAAAFTPGATVVASTSATERSAVPTTEGALVDSVQEDGPAELAGLLPGDVITAIDGQTVHSSAELFSLLYPDPPGTQLAVTFERDGTVATTTVALEDNDGDAPGGDSSP
jgi:S1-C subfamily serine protease